MTEGHDFLEIHTSPEVLKVIEESIEELGQQVALMVKDRVGEQAGDVMVPVPTFMLIRHLAIEVVALRDEVRTLKEEK